MSGKLDTAEGSSPSKSESEQNLDLSTEEGLRKIIECPICLDIPMPPIYLCAKGHIVCSGCQIRTDICPLCRSRYGSTRSFVAESIVEKCTLRCKHSEQGCQMTCKGSDMPEHLKSCDFRPVKCDDCNGKWIEFQVYHSHLIDHHKINGVNQPEGFVVYNMNLVRTIRAGERFCWPQYYFKAYEKTFLLRLYASNWFICSWVGLLGSMEDCKKYQIKMELHLPSDETMVHTWSGKVCHFRDDPALDVYRKGKGLVIPLETMLDVAAVSSDVAEWMYHIKITELNTDSSSPDPLTTSPPVPSGEPEPIQLQQSGTLETEAAPEQTVGENTETSYRMQVSDRISSSISSTNHPTTNTHLLTPFGSANSYVSTFDTAMMSAYNNRYHGLLDSASNMAGILCSDWDDSDSATDYDTYG